MKTNLYYSFLIACFIINTSCDKTKNIVHSSNYYKEIFSSKRNFYTIYGGYDYERAPLFFPYDLHHSFNDNVFDLCRKGKPGEPTLDVVVSKIEKLNISDGYIYGYGECMNEIIIEGVTKPKYFIINIRTHKKNVFRNENNLKKFIEKLSLPFRFVKPKKIIDDFYEGIAPNFRDTLDDMKKSGLIIDKDRRIIAVKIKK